MSVRVTIMGIIDSRRRVRANRRKYRRKKNGE